MNVTPLAPSRDLDPKPHTENHSVPAGLIFQLVELVKRWNVPPAELLDGLELPEVSLGEVHTRVPLAAYVEAVDRARRLTGEPGLGFCMGLEMRASAFGHFGFAAMSAATVREAIELAVQFAPILSTALGLRLRVESGVASLIVDEHADLGPVRDVLIIARLAGLWRIALALTGRDLRGTAEMAIPEPAYHARFAHLVPPARYDQPTNRIVMTEGALDVPLIMADPTAFRLAREQCDEAIELEALSLGGRLVRSARQLIGKPEGGFRSLDEVASALHMSSRTLKRKLARQGTSITTLLREERRDRALLLLRSPGVPIEEVADRLGYWSPQNFARAFRQWTGTTPAAYRRSHVNRAAS
ncbi:MAG TPA: AraC family transcriptional regulator ligand-binding domain-containing protein [Polyangiaceae bacterium]|nr:AraC family transcriptional regulator ligand-binding domain-containing protein [Polyangiaceae bacterium]